MTAYPVPMSCRGVFERAKTSKAAAIKAMCLQCTGFDRKTIRDCQSEDCALWPHRPFQTEKLPETGTHGA